jgi:RES domain-containing protein
MWVPSFVESTEKNLLLNPAHPSYSGLVLTIERHPFTFDPRLF